MSDQVLDKAAEFASKRTGGKHDEQIEKARRAADDRIGRPDGSARRDGDRR